MNADAQIGVIILTKDETLHIERCIRSILPVTRQIFIVDSYSSDDTCEIGRNLGAEIFQNPFVNQAVQFQWALDNCPITTPWIMRLDADEYVTPELAAEIQGKLVALDENTTGIILKRQVHFMDRWIKHGGYYPTKLLRIWRNGVGSIEQRWMDEHIKLTHGQTIEFEHDIVDHNLNNLTWWTEKHNHYATREAVDLLNKKYDLFREDSINKQLASKQQDEKKRWYKDNLYVRAPLFLRAFLYFGFRYFIQLGFLDGRPGLIWHFLQGCWYRFLVDAKIAQIEYRARKEQRSVRDVLEKDYGFNL